MPGLKKGIVILAALALAAIYLGSGPSLARERGAATPVVQRPTRESASFPHGIPNHRSIDCSRCHTVSFDRPDVTVFPGHNTCISCHNFALETFNRPITFCAACHDGRPISRTNPALFDFPKPGIATDFGMDFSHPDHRKPLPSAGRIVRPRGAPALFEARFTPGASPACTDCHLQVHPFVAGRPDMLTASGHSSCFTCHGEAPVHPPNMNQCGSCHTFDGPAAPDLFGSVRGFRHDDHDLDIRPKTKAEINRPKPPDYMCVECHSSAHEAQRLDAIRLPEESYCTQCHNAKWGLPEALSREILDSLRRR